MSNDLGFNTYLIDAELYAPLHAACYLIQDGDEFAIIDNGTQHTVKSIIEKITALGGTPEQVRWVIPTHVHLDHAGGSGELMKQCSNATLVSHPSGTPHLIDPSRLTAGATAVYGEEAFARDFGVLSAIDESRVIAADDGQCFDLGTRQLRFIHTPGHANHHGCIFDSQSQYIFTGDTFGLGYSEYHESGSPLLFATTTPVAFDPDAWFESLKKIEALNPSAACLTHFGLINKPIKHVEQLKQSIQAHVDIALNEEKNESDGRVQRLHQTLETHFVERATQHHNLDAATARKIFESDIELNAQGLAIWLARRAKKRG